MPVKALREGNTMRITIAIIFMAAVAAQGLVTDAASAEQRCRMEKQCRWENYKKICTYVKVCRDS
jgi:hypothetical protein